MFVSVCVLVQHWLEGSVSLISFQVCHVDLLLSVSHKPNTHTSFGQSNFSIIKGTALLH